jgi:hypothetical protein
MNKTFFTAVLIMIFTAQLHAQEGKVKQPSGKEIESAKRTKGKVEKPVGSKPSVKKQQGKKLEFVSKDRLQQR